MTTQQTFANFLALNNKVYFFNDTADSVRTLNNANNTGTVAAIPNGRFVTTHQGYVFVWGNSNTNLNGFKNSKIYRIDGNIFDPSNVTYAIEKIPLDSSIGIIGYKTIKEHRNTLIFMTNNGFYAYRGSGIQPEKISFLLGFDTNAERVDALLGAANRSAITYRDKYYCSSCQTNIVYGGQNITNYRVFILDENGKWWQDYLDSGSDSNTLGGGAAADWFIHNDNLYSISSFSRASPASLHTIRQWEVAGTYTETQDDGTSGNVNFSYLTKEFDFGKEVFFRHCYVHLRRQTSGTLTFEVNTDQRGAVSTSVDMTTPDTGTTESSSSNVLRKKVSIGRKGRTVQFRMYDRGNNAVEIYSIELEYDK